MVEFIEPRSFPSREPAPKAPDNLARDRENLRGGMTSLESSVAAKVNPGTFYGHVGLGQDPDRDGAIADTRPEYRTTLQTLVHNLVDTLVQEMRNNEPDAGPLIDIGGIRKAKWQKELEERLEDTKHRLTAACFQILDGIDSDLDLAREFAEITLPPQRPTNRKKWKLRKPAGEIVQEAARLQIEKPDRYASLFHRLSDAAQKTAEGAKAVEKEVKLEYAQKIKAGIVAESQAQQQEQRTLATEQLAGVTAAGVMTAAASSQPEAVTWAAGQMGKTGQEAGSKQSSEPQPSHSEASETAPGAVSSPGTAKSAEVSAPKKPGRTIFGREVPEGNLPRLWEDLRVAQISLETTIKEEVLPFLRELGIDAKDPRAVSEFFSRHGIQDGFGIAKLAQSNPVLALATQEITRAAGGNPVRPEMSKQISTMHDFLEPEIFGETNTVTHLTLLAGWLRNNLKAIIEASQRTGLNQSKTTATEKDLSVLVNKIKGKNPLVEPFLANLLGVDNKRIADYRYFDQGWIKKDERGEVEELNAKNFPNFLANLMAEVTFVESILLPNLTTGKLKVVA